MKFIVENRTFEQVAPYHGELLFVTDSGKSLVGVTFDKKNNPHIHCKEGPVYFKGLPTKIQDGLIEKIKVLYPSGFNS